MRVLILGDPGFVPVQNLSRFLASAGHEVHLATFSHDDPPMGARAHRIRHTGRLGLLLARREVERLARAIRPDLVHAFYLTSYGFLASRVTSCPILASAMGTDVFGAPELSPWLAPLRRRLTAVALRRADLVHSVADHMTDHLERIGVLSSKLETFPRGVDLDRFRPRGRASHPAPPYAFLCNRKLEPVYDHSTLIDGLAQARRQGVEFKLLIVGDGELRPSLEARVRQRGLVDRVTFVGHVPHMTVPAILGDTDVFLTTPLSDGTSSCLLEALAAGAIPIVSDIPANRPWVKDGVTGFLFPPGDATSLAQAVIAAVSATDRWEEMRTANRVVVESRGDLRQGHERTLAIYARLVAARSQSR